MSAIDVTQLPIIDVRVLLGGTVLAVDDETGEAAVRYTPGPQLNNPVGGLFGGFIAAMIDDVAALSAWFGGARRPFATAQLSVHFLTPARSGESLIGRATVVKAGSRQLVVDVKLSREADGELVATATVLQSFLGAAPATTGKRS